MSWLGCVIAERKGTGTAYYKAKKYVERLMGELGIEVEFCGIDSEKNGQSGRAGKILAKSAETRPFEPKRAAEVYVAGTDEKLGVVGEFKNSVRNAFKLAPFLAGFELDLEIIDKHIGEKRELYFGELEKRDLTVSTEKSYQEVVNEIQQVLQKNKIEAEISPMGIYQPEGKKQKNISVHLAFHGKASKKVMKALEQF